MDKEPVKPPVKSTPNPAAITSAQIERLLAEGKVEEATKLLALRKQMLELVADEELGHEKARVEEQRLIAIQEEMEKREYEQSECPHVKPNGYPAVGGIRDSHNNTHYICLRCQKMWVNDQLPMHLRQNLNPIGGPVLS